MPDNKLTEGTTPIDYEGTLKSLTESYYNALDSINRLQVENERLKSLMPEKRCDNCIHEEKSLQASPCCECFNYRNFAPKNFLKLIKAEAYKEFAERLKDKHRKIIDYDEAGFGAQIFIVEEKVIDNLLKEMAGDNNGQ